MLQLPRRRTRAGQSRCWLKTAITTVRFQLSTTTGRGIPTSCASKGASTLCRLSSRLGFSDSRLQVAPPDTGRSQMSSEGRKEPASVCEVQPFILGIPLPPSREEGHFREPNGRVG